MAAIDRTRTIAATPTQIWETLADFGAIGSWADNVDHSCILNHGATPVGTTRRVQVGRDAFVERITEFDPQFALGYDIEGLPRIFGTVSNRWCLEGTGAGGTVVTLTSRVTAGSRVDQQLAERVACRMLARQSDAMLAGLATRLESADV